MKMRRTARKCPIQWASTPGLSLWLSGAFLAWSISYSLQMQKEALKKRSSREGLLLLKNQYLDQLADLESRKREGKVSEQRYKREYNNGRLRLAKVLEKIEASREQPGLSFSRYP